MMLVPLATEQVDIVQGYKRGRGDPWYRKVIGRVYHHAVKLLFPEFSDDEEAVAHAFRDAMTSRDGRLRRLRFQRANFAGSVVVEERFRHRSLPSPEAVIDNFDAIGIMDRLGRFDGVLTLAKILIDTP